MKKSIIIDFDNTIGYFSQIIYVLNIIEKTYKYKLNNSQIFFILDKYPNIFRPKIFDIINLIKRFKENDDIEFFILYTCNNNEHFVNIISSYLEYKIKKNNIFNFKLFNKGKKKAIETIYEQTNNKINVKSALCFIDDKKFNYNVKNHNSIKYIKCEKYIYNYSLEDIIELFPFEDFRLITKSLIKKYFVIIYKKKPIKPQLPRKSYEINSNYIINLLNRFIYSSV